MNEPFRRQVIGMDNLSYEETEQDPDLRMKRTATTREAYSSVSTMVLPEAPPDTHHFAAIIIFLLGIASLLPWNFFLSANDFWMYKFRNLSDPDAYIKKHEFTPDQKYFNSYLTIASSLTFIVFIVVNTLVSDKIRCNLRIEGSLFLNIVLFTVITVSTFINTDNSQELFLYIALLFVIVANMLSGILQGGGSGATGCLPAKYMTIKAIGQAVAGVVSSLAQAFFLLLDLTPETTACLYFSFATLILIATQVGFYYLKKMPFYQFYVSDELPGDNGDLTSETPKGRRAIPFLKIFLDGWQYHISIGLVLIFTLPVWPSVCALIAPGPNDLRGEVIDKLFVTLICYVSFNFFDMMGRILALYWPMNIARKNLLLTLSVARVLFVPLFFMCNVSPNSDTRIFKPVLLDSEWYLIIMLFFGLSNGYVMTTALAYAPKATRKDYQEVAGSMVVAFDGFGLFLGSMLSYLTVRLI